MSEVLGAGVAAEDGGEDAGLDKVGAGGEVVEEGEGQGRATEGRRRQARENAGAVGRSLLSHGDGEVEVEVDGNGDEGLGFRVSGFGFRV
jgi:hypothetical protein